MFNFAQQKGKGREGGGANLVRWVLVAGKGPDEDLGGWAAAAAALVIALPHARCTGEEKQQTGGKPTRAILSGAVPCFSAARYSGPILPSLSLFSAGARAWAWLRSFIRESGP